MSSLRHEGLTDESILENTRSGLYYSNMYPLTISSLESRQVLQPYIWHGGNDSQSAIERSTCYFVSKTYAKHARVVSMFSKFHTATKEILGRILFDSGMRLFWIERRDVEETRKRRKAAPTENVVLPISTKDERIVALIYIVIACYAFTIMALGVELRKRLLIATRRMRAFCNYTRVRIMKSVGWIRTVSLKCLTVKAQQDYCSRNSLKLLTKLRYDHTS